MDINKIRDIMMSHDSCTTTLKSEILAIKQLIKVDNRTIFKVSDDEIITFNILGAEITSIERVVILNNSPVVKLDFICNQMSKNIIVAEVFINQSGLIMNERIDSEYNTQKVMTYIANPRIDYMECLVLAQIYNHTLFNLDADYL